MNKSPALKFNIPDDRRCTRVPVECFKHTTLSAALIAGEVFSYSSSGADGARSTFRTYKKFNDKLGVSYATISRGLKRLKSDGVIERISQSEYRSKLPSTRQFIRMLYWVNGSEFDINGKKRKLTPSEKAVFGYIYTMCDNGKRGGNKLRASNKDIASVLGLHKDTVSRCVAVLARLGLIIKDRPEEDRFGVRKSTYHINNRLLSSRSRGHQRDPESDTIARADWYAERRQRAEAIADRNRKKATSDSEYKRVMSEITRAAIEEGRAEDGGDKQKIDNCAAHREKLERQRIIILNRLGLKPEDLEAHYHCTKCNDTGFDQRGRLCDCYVGVGELDK